MLRLSSQSLLALSLLAAISVSPLTGFAEETLQETEQKNRTRDTKKHVEQESIKARATLWRESTSPEDNPSSLTLSDSFPDKAWWEQFHDPFLNSCIQQAVNANINLAIAHERIEQARANARISLGRELPQISLQPTASRSRNSSTIIRSFGGSSRGGSSSSSGGSPSSGFSSGGGGFGLGEFINYFSIPLNASYEIDYLRKNRDRTHAVNKQLEATQRDFETTHIMLVTDVANAYFNLLAADELIDLQKDLIETGETDLFHARRRFEAGLVNEEDVVLREGRLTTFKAQLQDYYQMQALALNQLAILMGQTPHQVAQLNRTEWTRYNIPFQVDAGIPSELLTRRPDIVAAEDRLAASGLLVQVARKQLFPSINLNGQFGFASAQVKDLFKWDSYVASIAGSLMQGVYTGGQAKANLRLTKSQYNESLLTYRQAVLQSFKDVDDSLASLKAHRNAFTDYDASLASLLQRGRIQQNRVEAGIESEADVAPLNIEIVQAREGLARTKLSAMIDVLSLYKALGGGY